MGDVGVSAKEKSESQKEAVEGSIKSMARKVWREWTLGPYGGKNIANGGNGQC